ncbi:hypothetical protein OAD66_09010 [Bacteroidia bacterium]|nr:hypothetical protein [Bacteroidia bacterium]MDB4107422.1 hypothetical protein [Bacteroidia bacterium]MDB9883256.1 hypothetical protein [Bacteroidia bacterium]
MIRLLSYISYLLLLTSCFLPDEVLPRVSPKEITIRLNKTDKQTAYVDLSKIDKSSDSTRGSWHLKFQNSAKGWAIYLNTLESVAVYNTKITDFDKVNESNYELDLKWQVDIPTPSGLYPAIGDWGDFGFANPKSYKDVFLISWNDGNTTLIEKLQILDASETAYHIRYGSLNGDSTKTIWINKNSEHTHSYFSFKENSQISNIEPNVDKWNMCFTYLSDSIENHHNLPYTETINPNFGLYQGLAINYKSNHVYFDTATTFDEIDYFQAVGLEYIRKDEIINPFMIWDSLNSTSTVNSKLTLIIKNYDSYFALKPISITRLKNDDYTIRLIVKQL